MAIDVVTLDLNLYKIQPGLIAARTIKPKLIAINGNPKTFALNPFLGEQRKNAPVSIIIPATNKRLGSLVNFSFKAG